MSQQSNILPVNSIMSEAIEANKAYYRNFNDEELLERFKEASDIWFRLLMTDPHPDYADGYNETLEFWQNNRDNLETIAKERNLIL